MTNPSEVVLTTAGSAKSFDPRNPKNREENLLPDQGVDDFTLKITAAVENTTMAPVTCSTTDLRKILAAIAMTQAIRNVDPHYKLIPLNVLEIFAYLMGLSAEGITAAAVAATTEDDFVMTLHIPMLALPTKIRLSREWRVGAAMLGILETTFNRGAQPALTTGLTLNDVTIQHIPVPRPTRRQYVGPLAALSVQGGNSQSANSPAGLVLAAYATSASTVTRLTVRSGTRSLFEDLSQSEVGTFYPETAGWNTATPAPLPNGFGVLLIPDDAAEPDLNTEALTLTQEGTSIVNDIGLYTFYLPDWKVNTWNAVEAALISLFSEGPVHLAQKPTERLRLLSSNLGDGGYRARKLSNFAPRWLSFNPADSADLPRHEQRPGGDVVPIVPPSFAAKLARMPRLEAVKTLAAALPGGYVEGKVQPEVSRLTDRILAERESA